MTLLVDDQELARRLRSDSFDDSSERIYTTGLWYVRLCQAVIRSVSGAATSRGKLSGPFDVLPAARRDEAQRAILSLPSEVGMLSLRDLGPRIGQLRGVYRLNLLATEALATAIELGAQVVLSAPSPHLESALAREGCTVRRLYH